MQLSKTTEYAVRALIYLQLHPGIQKLEEIATEMDIPMGYLVKVLHLLKRNKIVDTFQGVNGGYQLGMDAEILSLYQILQVTEKTIKINSCLEDGKCALSGKQSRCRTGAYRIYCELQEILEAKMKGVILKDLASDVRKG